MRAIQQFLIDNNWPRNDIYLIGGAALYHHGVKDYVNDYDILIQPQEFYTIENMYGKVDCVPLQKALLADGWQERAVLIDTAEMVDIKILSIEDIAINITSGIHAQKYYNNLLDILQYCDIKKLRNLIALCKNQYYIYIRQDLFYSNLAILEEIING